MKIISIIIAASLVSGSGYAQSYEEQMLALQRDQLEEMRMQHRMENIQRNCALTDALAAQAHLEFREADRDYREALQALFPPAPVPVYIVPRLFTWPTDCE